MIQSRTFSFFIVRDVGKGVFCPLILWIKFVSDEDVKFTALISSYKSSILNQYNVRTCIYAYPVRQDYKNTHIIDNSQASTCQLKLSKQYMGALLLSKFKEHSD